MSGLDIYRMILDTAETILFLILVVGIRIMIKRGTDGNRTDTK